MKEFMSGKSRAFGALITTIATAFLLTACGGGGSSGATPATPTVVGTPGSAYWASATKVTEVTPAMQAVVTRLPVACTSSAQTCWEDLVKTPGKIPFVSTTAVMIGFNVRPIVAGYFQDNKIGSNGQDGLYHIWLAYGDTGEKATGNDITDGGFAAVIKRVANDPLGTGFIFQDGTGACWRLKWNPPTATPGVASNIWNVVTATCPATW